VPGKTTSGARRQRIAARLKALRQSRGMTTRQVAERMGKTQGLVSHLENARCGFDVDYMYRLADLYGVHVTEILCDSGIGVGGDVEKSWSDPKYRAAAQALARAHRADAPEFAVCMKILESGC